MSEQPGRGGAWTQLVDVAVLGAARATVPPPGGPLAGLVAGGADDSTRLLHLAAAASRARRAGYRAARAGDAAGPEPAAEDPRPEVSRAARLRLRYLIAEGRTELVIEWLRLLAPVGCRPPDVLLPVLLAAATDSQAVRDVLVPVLGPLAGWLAAANPAWEWATAAGQASAADSAGWTTASLRDRRELLTRVRQADPAAGRDLVAATWSSDSYRDRTAFVTALAVGLSSGDEPLLDQALTDKRGEVRRAAADLLARLPGSGFGRRAAGRAAAAVRVERTGTGSRLAVSPPAEATADMMADCIDPSPPQGTGRLKWLLRQVVAAAPAGWWAGHAGLPPADLLALSARTEWAPDLEAAWTDAAIRDADASWIDALLDRPLGAGNITVFQALTDADRDSWLRRHPDSPLFAALELVPAPWSAGLSAVARTRIAATACADPGRSPEPRKLLRLAALRLEPPEPPALDPAQVHPRLHESWAGLLSTLSDRAAMRRELAEEPTS